MANRIGTIHTRKRRSGGAAPGSTQTCHRSAESQRQTQQQPQDGIAVGVEGGQSPEALPPQSPLPGSPSALAAAIRWASVIEGNQRQPVVAKLLPTCVAPWLYWR